MFSVWLVFPVILSVFREKYGVKFEILNDFYYFLLFKKIMNSYFSQCWRSKKITNLVFYVNYRNVNADVFLGIDHFENTCALL